jgi:site-specific DNA-methyltransferase (adenine-specific)
MDFFIYNHSCYGLKELPDSSVQALITDPPYGISYQNKAWDKPKEYGESRKSYPPPEIWEDCFRVMKAGAFGVVFSFPRVMHRLMVDLEDSGFIIKDVLMWVYLNGMPKMQNIGLDIDKLLGVESEIIGQYKYVQGYVENGAENYKTKKPKNILTPISEMGKRYNGAGVNLKPAYEPIILIQKPIEKGLTVAENIKKYGTGALNLEATRLPYEKGEGKVGHNPNPKGRVPANILRTEKWEDGKDKYFYYGDKEINILDEIENKEFFYAKVRQNKEDFNKHPTLKPVPLMKHLVELLTFGKNLDDSMPNILDPFMGSGSTGVACLQLNREFIGYELENDYFEMAKRRLENESMQLKIS